MPRTKGARNSRFHCGSEKPAHALGQSFHLGGPACAIAIPAATFFCFLPWLQNPTHRVVAALSVSFRSTIHSRRSNKTGRKTPKAEGLFTQLLAPRSGWTPRTLETPSKASVSIRYENRTRVSFGKSGAWLASTKINLAPPNRHGSAAIPKS